MRPETIGAHVTRKHVLVGFAALTLLALALADIRLLATQPWETLAQMGRGLIRPDFAEPVAMARAAGITVAFALCGVFLGAATGLLLAPFYHRRLVRHLCIAVRAVHELFWALLLLQVTGLSPATGVLAIALPYAGIFAKVFAETMDEVDPTPLSALPARTGTVSALLFGRLPQARRDMLSYTLYRIECGLRSAAVLGFIGLPTLGFLLEGYFLQGTYGAAAAVFFVYLALILPLRIWMRWPLAPVYLVASLWMLGQIRTPPMGDGVLWRFFTQDIVPAPLRDGGWLAPPGWTEFAGWFASLGWEQILPGIAVTLVLSQLALALAAGSALIGFPLLVRRVAGRGGAMLGHLALVLSRSVPDYMLAFVLLQVTGPSMLPAILALGVHNGAIIAHLMGRRSELLSRSLRDDAPRGLTLWGYELVPRQFGVFLALCLYRWEIIVRDSAIFGLIGVATLGFHVDAAIQQLRIDRALVLLLAMGGLTLLIDTVSERLRKALRLAAVPETTPRGAVAAR